MSRTKKGISYRISRAGGRKRIDSAFTATVVGGRLPANLRKSAAQARTEAYLIGGEQLVKDWSHLGVFVRRGASRLPIYEARGPSIRRLLTGKSQITARVQERSAVTLEKEIKQQVHYELSKWSKK